MDINTYNFNIVRDHLTNAWELSFEDFQDDVYGRTAKDYPLTVDLLEAGESTRFGFYFVCVRLEGVTSFRGSAPDAPSVAFRMYSIKDDEIARITPVGDHFDYDHSNPFPEEDA